MTIHIGHSWAHSFLWQVWEYSPERMEQTVARLRFKWGKFSREWHITWRDEQSGCPGLTYRTEVDGKCEGWQLQGVIRRIM